jgi:hypothetical protein
MANYIQLFVHVGRNTRNIKMKRPVTYGELHRIAVALSGNDLDTFELFSQALSKQTYGPREYREYVATTDYNKCCDHDVNIVVARLIKKNTVTRNSDAALRNESLSVQILPEQQLSKLISDVTQRLLNTSELFLDVQKDLLNAEDENEPSYKTCFGRPLFSEQ